MSRAGSRRRSCSTKRRYRDMQEAKRVKSMREAKGSGKLRAYPCPWCKGVHLTSTSSEVA